VNIFIKALAFGAGIVIFSLVNFSAANSQDRITPEEVGGLVEAFRAQTAAWQTGDVLFTVESFFDSTEEGEIGEYEESMGFHRFRFDHAKKNYWYHGSTVTKRGESVPGQPLKEQRSVKAESFSVKQGIARIRKGPNHSFPSDFSVWSTWVDTHKLPQLAFGNIGFLPYDAHSIAMGELIVQSRISGLGSRSASRRVDGGIRISFVNHNPKVVGMYNEGEWEWDSVLLAPTRHTLSEHHTDRQIPLKLKVWEESFAWDHVNAVLVPIHVIRETPISVRRGDKVWNYTRNKTARFHWLSVNTPIPIEAFEISIDDVTKLEAERG